MRAITADRFGDADALMLQDIAKPEPKTGEVLVRVAAAGVNPLDIQTRQGAYSDHITAPYQLGVELSGTIEALGAGVENFAVGDEVFYSVRVLENEGGYAEYHTEKAELIAHKPASLSFVEAAAMPIAASTAWVCLIERSRLKPGDRVLILGGSGGVGLFAIQIASMTGASIVATCRKDAKELVQNLGADQAVDYKDPAVWNILKNHSGGGYDVIVDLIGGDAIENSLGLLAPGGRIASIVDQSTPQNLLAGWDYNAEIHLVFLEPSTERLARIGSLAERGLLKTVIERTLPLEQAAQAHRLIEAGGRTGKIVLVIS